MSSEVSSNQPVASQVNDDGLKVDLVVNEGAKVAVFHNKPFGKPLSWLEFNLDSRDLSFVLDNGDAVNFGVKVPEDFARDMQNAYQVLMVQTDEKTGEYLSGDYFPIIIHRA